MGQILIRNLDDNVLTALKERARRHGASTEEEARQLLTAGVGLSRAEWLARIDALREQNGPQTGPTSEELLAIDRARDDDR